MPLKILLADDSITIQKIVHQTFEHEPVELTLMGNGDAALRRLEEEHPDLILADVFMPGKNGYELCEAVKQNSDLVHIPVILLIGAFEPFNTREAERVHADDHLMKPFAPKMLLEKVRKYLQWESSEPAVEEAPVEPPAESTAPFTTQWHSEQLVSPPAVESEVRSIETAPPIEIPQPSAETFPLPPIEQVPSIAPAEPPIALSSAVSVEQEPQLQAQPVVEPQEEPAVVPEEKVQAVELPAEVVEEAAPTPGAEAQHAEEEPAQEYGPMPPATFSEEPVSAAPDIAASPISPPRLISFAPPALEAEALSALLQKSKPADEFAEFQQHVAVHSSAPETATPEDVLPLGAIPSHEQASSPSTLELPSPYTLPAGSDQEAEMKRSAGLDETRSQARTEEVLGGLSEEAIDAIARRVVERMSTRVIEEIAWEVVPEVAESLLRRNISQKK